jgi:integrase
MERPGQVEHTREKMKVKLKHVYCEPDRHGKDRVYVRRNGRRIRIRATPNTPEFMLACTAAIDACGAAPEHARRPNGRVILPGSLAAIAAKYFASKDFQRLDATSQSNRRNIIESCMREKLVGNDQLADMPAKIFNASHMKWLMDAKEDLPAAANNRRKYFSAMLGWAVQQAPPLVIRNAARDVKVVKSKTDGFYTWSDEDVLKFEAHHPIGSKARLALALLLYTGLRRSDAIRVGPQNVRNGMIEIVPEKTKDERPELTFKPVLPELAEVIAATPTIGLKAYLVSSWGKPYTPAGFGNWFRDQCNAAGLPQCSAHGLRKAAACRCADAGATLSDLMKLFDWSSSAVAAKYIQKADKKRATERTIKLLSRRPYSDT